MFSMLLGPGGLPRLEATPRDLVRLLDLVGADAFKALLLLAAPVGDDISGDEGWEVRVLVSRGLDELTAVRGIAELRVQGYLDGKPPRRTSTPRVPQPLVQHPTPMPPVVRCTVCNQMKPRSTNGLTTYAIKRGRYVKIGVTKQLHIRLRDLARPDPGVLVPAGWSPTSRLVLLGTTSQGEHDLHEQFAGDHEIGEWFRDSPGLRRALRSLGGLS